MELTKGAEWEIAPGRLVGDNHPTFIIAEIGQNHQGDINIAKQMIRACKEAGADCVKFQKSTVDERFNKRCLARPYDVPQSWGKTYGEHKKFLEFSEESYVELKRFAEEEVGVIFSASGFDHSAIDFLAKIKIPFFKVPSPDVGNLEFIDYMAQKNIPMVISSGMQDMATMRRVYATVKRHHDRFAFLQCTSAYPVTPTNVNLRVIQSYKKEFPDIPVGYSGHETGTTITLGAVALGARIVERHVTLDKTWKGSDHSASLSMDELATLVREIRVLEASLGTPEKDLLETEAFVKRKLGKSVVAVGDLKKGQVLKKENLTIKNAEPTGFPPHHFDKLIGSSLLEDVADDETIPEDSVKFKAADDSGSESKKKFAALILARAGSKGIPGKNIKIINGKPLIAWSILAIQKAACFDEIWVSTDGDEIGRVAEQYGAKYHRRDPTCATDTSTSAEGFKEFLDKHPEIYAVANVQCTTPTQEPEKLLEAASYIKDGHYDCVFSAMPSHKFRWSPVVSEGQMTFPLNFNPLKRPRRQDWAGDIVESGAYYMFLTSVFLETGSFQTGRVRYVMDSATDNVDIDTPEDFARAELLVQRHAVKYGLDDSSLKNGSA